jgi:hypothetical protein
MVVAPTRRRLFRSYAHADFALVQCLNTRLLEHLGACTTLACDVWDDGQILIGEAWEAAIQGALGCSDAGLLMLSPAALASRYIKHAEIPALLPNGKLLIVGLKPVDFKTQLPPALAKLQIFRVRASRGQSLCYSECATAKQRDAFAFGLYQQLVSRLA